MLLSWALFQGDEKEDVVNKVTVNIQGLEFTLKGEGSEEHLTRVGKTVDELISTMMQSNRKLNVSTAAILTSCNLVDGKFKLEETLQDLDSREARFEEEKKALQEEIDALNRSISEKNRMIDGLSSQESQGLKQKESEITKLGVEMQLLKDSAKEYRDDNEQLSKLNKELKFELQSYKYKVLDLQNKLFENQMTITKDKKDNAAKADS